MRATLRLIEHALALAGAVLIAFFGWLVWLRPPSQIARVRELRSQAIAEAQGLQEELLAKNAELAAARGALAQQGDAR